MIMMNNRKAFTMAELLTVVVIIALLLGIILPSMTAVRTKAKETAQKAQLGIIAIGLEAFKQDYGDYPQSNYNNLAPPATYSGPQKLAEALVGWDLMGFHPKTSWRADGYTATGPPYFVANPPLTSMSYDPDRDRGLNTLSERKGPYIDVAAANAFKLSELYNNFGPLSSNPLNTYVLCDVYHVRKLTDKAGKTVFAGSPILYYKANTLNKTIDANYATTNVVLPQTYSDRIYDYYDNYLITSSYKLTVYGDGGQQLLHPLDYIDKGNEHTVFYGDQTRYNPVKAPGYAGSGIGYGIRDTKIGNPVRPYNPDSYILISAGRDGLYGTADDIHNF
jgi:prepilin-type N-terminal cleavage/methylation domain-containing protein